MLPETLIALACMIANNGPVDTSGIEAQLSQDEKAQIESIITSGACLPEKVENLIKDTHHQISQDNLGDFSLMGQEPTRGC